MCNSQDNSFSPNSSLTKDNNEKKTSGLEDSNAEKTLRRVIKKVMKSNDGKSLNGADVIQAYGMAYDYANRGFYRHEAEILIQKLVPNLAEIQLTALLEKAYTSSRDNLYPVLNAPSLARYVLEQAQGNIRVRSSDNGFLFWTGTHWSVNEGQQKVEHAIKEILDTLLEHMKEPHKSDYLTWLNDPENDKLLIKAVNREAERIPNSIFEEISRLLHFENGGYSFFEKKLVMPEREQYLTDDYRLNGEYDENAKCSGWKVFLNRVTKGDKTLLDYLHMLCGYILCAGVNYRSFVLVFWNQGGNGGTLMLKALQHVMGGYAGILPSSFLYESDKPADDLSYLSRKHLLTLSNTEFNNNIDSKRLNDLTRDFPIEGWNANKKEWECFKLKGTLIMETNRDPRGINVGTERNNTISVIPFFGGNINQVSFEDMIASERNGILAWMMKGYHKLDRNNDYFGRPDGVFDL